MLRKVLFCLLLLNATFPVRRIRSEEFATISHALETLRQPSFCRELDLHGFGAFSITTYIDQLVSRCLAFVS